jgi:hypothetical protein
VVVPQWSLVDKPVAQFREQGVEHPDASRNRHIHSCSVPDPHGEKDEVLHQEILNHKNHESKNIPPSQLSVNNQVLVVPENARSFEVQYAHIEMVYKTSNERATRKVKHTVGTDLPSNLSNGDVANGEEHTGSCCEKDPGLPLDLVAAPTLSSAFLRAVNQLFLIIKLLLHFEFFFTFLQENLGL